LQRKPNLSRLEQHELISQEKLKARLLGVDVSKLDLEVAKQTLFDAFTPLSQLWLQAQSLKLLHEFLLCICMERLGLA